MADRSSPVRSGKRSKHGVNEALAALYREAEEIVVQGRLDQIEKDNRSKGAMLDDRNLHDLDNVRAIPKKRAGMANRDSTGRRAAMAVEELNKQTTKTFTAMEISGEIMQEYMDEGYENELLIWKTKSRNPSYSLKRKYDNPELEHLRESLTPEQKVFYKEKTKRLFFELVSRLRHDMVLQKVDQDSMGVFHPNANTQRTHCSYWTKLYHEITCTNIEDRVLKTILRDMNSDPSKDAGGQEKAALNNSFDQLFSAKKHSRTGLAAAAMGSNEPHGSKSKVGAKDKTSKARSSSVVGNTVTFSVNESQHQKAADTTPAVSVDDVNSMSAAAAELSEGAAPNGKEGAEGGASALDGNSIAAASLDSTSLASKQSQQDKLFAKIKRGRLGDADPRLILLEEAARFDEATVLAETLQRDTNNIIDNELADWAVGQARAGQLKKVALGESDLPQSLQVGGLEQGAFFVSKGGFAPAAAASLSSAKDNSKELLLQRMQNNLLSFDEFYEMHRSAFDNIALENNQRAAAAAATIKTTAGTGASAKSKASTRGTTVAAATAAVTVVVDPLVDKIDRMNIAPAECLTSLLSGESVSSDGRQTSVGNNNIKSIDIVQDFAGKDPNYSSYLKTMARESAKGKMLSKGVASLTKAKKLRRLPKLGETTCVFTDSKGKVKDITFKGFANHFTDKAHDSDDEEDEQSQQSHADDDDVKTASSTATGLEENLDESPSSPSAEQQRSPTPGSRATSSRRKLRSRKARARTPTEGSREELHTQLLLAWEILQVPTYSRLVYMRKYCTNEYSRRLGESSRVVIDTAVLFAVRLQTLFIKRLLEDDSFQLPLSLGKFIEEAVSRVPKGLAQGSAVLTGRGDASVIQANFNSVAQEMFIRSKEYQSNYLYESAQQDRTMALRFADELLAWLTDSLVTLYSHSRDVLNDTHLLGNDLLKIVEKKKAPKATASP